MTSNRNKRICVLKGVNLIRDTQKDGATRCILGSSTCRPKIHCVNLYGKLIANNFLRK